MAEGVQELTRGRWWPELGAKTPAASLVVEQDEDDRRSTNSSEGAARPDQRAGVQDWIGPKEGTGGFTAEGVREKGSSSVVLAWEHGGESGC
jgi:hypothetical protein